MKKAVPVVVVLLALCLSVAAQSDGYYKAIQSGSANPIKPSEFKKLEQDALKNFSRPETYESLASQFGGTTERVWAAVYGETYCNLATDAEAIKKMGALVFQHYEKSLSKSDKGLSVSLTQSAEAGRMMPPFESQFEMAFLMSTITLGADPVPLSIQKLTKMRTSQLAMWTQKKLPETQLVRRQQAIIQAGHFEAYNYWLFQNARPDEFAEWLKAHQPQYQAWLDWNAKNTFSVQSPDLQRLFIVRGKA